MSSLHRVLAALVPAPRNEWIRAHAAEQECVEGRLNRVKWLVGAVPIASWALLSQLIRDPRSFLGGALARTLVFGLSLLNLAVGIALFVVYIVGAEGSMMLAIGIGLCGQSVFSLAYEQGTFLRRRALAKRVQLAASTLIAAIGLTAFSAGILVNTNPANTDPEFGPMTIALLAAVHGLASLVAISDKPKRPTPSGGSPARTSSPL